MNVRYKQIETINEFIDAIRIRIEVFIIEQKCPPGYDPDELDKASKHYIALVDNTIVAMVRLREDPKGFGKIENMVVKKEYRKKGIGTGLTEYITKQAQKQGYKKIWMQAQKHAQHVYEKTGFKVTSEPYDLYNLGIPHVDMEYIGK
jgi:predicted GNAT family N-acyltransferase